MTKQARSSIKSVFDDGETTPSGKAVRQKAERSPGSAPPAKPDHAGETVSDAATADDVGGQDPDTRAKQ